MTAMPIFHTAHLRVREDVIGRFRERLLRHARMSHDTEPGCHRFDIHQETNDPTLFLLIEIYADEIAFDAHRSSAHYLAFREDVKDWVTERTWWHWTELESG
jgi:autoinducer 2-degrading protein